MLPSGGTTPICEAPDTCIGAVCRSRFIAPDTLEPYRDDWAESYSDACKPLNPDEPEVEVGTGAQVFTTLADEAEVPVVFGPRGAITSGSPCRRAICISPGPESSFKQ